MSEVLEIQRTAQAGFSPVYDKEIYYPESHEDDTGKSTTHYELTSYFFDSLRIFFVNHADIFIAANLNLYYEERNSGKYYTPDVMIAFGVPNYNRKTYKLWEEKQFPQVVFEVASETTWKIDISDKVEDYERFGAEEYYLLDPENTFLPLPLMAYRRDDTGRLRLILTEDNRVLSPGLNLEIVRENEKFRLYDPAKQEFLLTTEELKTELDILKAALKNQN